MEGYKGTEIAGLVVLAIAALLWVFVSFVVAIEFVLIALGLLFIGDGMHHDSTEPKLIGTVLVLAGLLLLLITRVTVR